MRWDAIYAKLLLKSRGYADRHPAHVPNFAQKSGGLPPCLWSREPQPLFKRIPFDSLRISRMGGSMYCPKCATAVSEAQKFCPSCGLPLNVVASVVAGQPPTAGPDQTLVEILEKLRHRREKLMRRGFVMFGAGLMIGCLMVIAAGLQGYDPIFKTLIVVLVGLAGLFLFAGMSLMGYASFLPQAPAIDQSSQPRSLPRARPTTELPPAYHPEPVSSIIEHTTHRLEPALPKPPTIHE